MATDYNLYAPSLGDKDYPTKIKNLCISLTNDFLNDELFNNEIVAARSVYTDLNARLDDADAFSLSTYNEVATARNGATDLNTRITTNENLLNGIDAEVTAARKTFTDLDTRIASTKLTDLLDTPASYAGAGDFYLRVNTTGDAVIFTDANPTTGIADASADGQSYVRKDGVWILLSSESLIRSNNLSDVADVATARNNLSVYSKTETDNKIYKSSGLGFKLFLMGI